MDVHLVTNEEDRVVAILLKGTKIPLREPLNLADARVPLEILRQLNRYIDLNRLKIGVGQTLDKEYARGLLGYATPAQKTLVRVLFDSSGFVPKSDIIASMGRRRQRVGGGKGLSALVAGFTKTLKRDGIEPHIIDTDVDRERSEWAYKLNDTWKGLIEELIAEGYEIRS